MSKNRDIPPMHPASAMDFLPPAQLRDVQFTRLKDMVQRAFDHVALFRKRMDEQKLKPSDLRTLDDIVKLPFTVKTDLRDTYPFGLCASPMKEIVRFHASSGTTGKPIVVAYTQEDLNDWTRAVLRSLAACGVHNGDIVQVAYGYGLFTGGLGLHYGAEALGASVIPISGGNTDRQIMLMKDFGVTVICCTPSYFLHLIDRAAEMGVNLKELPLRIGVFGAEPWTEDMRERIEAGSDIKAYDIYGLSEIVGPGVANECVHQSGPHIFEDLFYPEIIDPKTLEPLPDGMEGELVLDDALQTRHADDPLPDARHHFARTHPLRLRPHAPPHQPHRPAQRRHAHHPRRQPVPVADRSRAAEGGRHAAALPDHRGPPEGPRHAGSAGGSDRRRVQRHRERHGTDAKTHRRIPSKASPACVPP